MNTLLVIDGNAIMHRAYHALPPFKTKKGVPTNAVYGFFTMLYKAIQDFHPEYIAVCFDTPAKTFRQKLHKEYQAQRPEIGDDFKEQIPIIKTLLEKTPIYQEEQDGLEADDVIGTIVTHAKKEGLKILILTGDKDIMQLVDKNTYVVSPQLGISNVKIYGEDEVQEKLHVPPHQIPDLKALIGDPSDNYKGAKGIGPKTASKYLLQYKTVEDLMAHLDDLPDEKVKKILLAHKKEIKLAKHLAVIVTDAQIKFTLDKAKFVGFSEELKSAFIDLEMRSLLQRFFNHGAPQAKQPKKKKEEKDPQIGLF